MSIQLDETVYTRTINIRSKDLGRDATLILTFDAEKMTGIYGDDCPSAWKYVYFACAIGYAHHY